MSMSRNGMKKACAKCAEEGNELKCLSFQPNPWQPERCSVCFHTSKTHTGRLSTFYSSPSLNYNPSADSTTSQEEGTPSLFSSGAMHYSLPLLPLPSPGSPRQITQPTRHRPVPTSSSPSSSPSSDLASSFLSPRSSSVAVTSATSDSAVPSSSLASGFSSGPILRSISLPITDSPSSESIASTESTEPESEPTPSTSATTSQQQEASSSTTSLTTEAHSSPSPSLSTPSPPSSPENEEQGARRSRSDSSAAGSRIYSPLLLRAKQLDKLSTELFAEAKKMKTHEDDFVVADSTESATLVPPLKIPSLPTVPSPRMVEPTSPTAPPLSGLDSHSKHKTTTTWGKSMGSLRGLGRRNQSLNVKQWAAQGNSHPSESGTTSRVKTLDQALSQLQAAEETIRLLQKKIVEVQRERDDYKDKYHEQLRVNKEIFSAGKQSRRDSGSSIGSAPSKHGWDLPANGSHKGSIRRKNQKIKALPASVLQDFFSPPQEDDKQPETRALHAPPLRRRRGSIFLESPPEFFSPRENSSEQLKDPESVQKKREKVQEEILTTERNYLMALNIVVEALLNPLRVAANENRPILPKKDIKAIFFQLEVIRGYTSALYQQLENRLVLREKEDPSPVLLGDIFLQMADYLRTYILYTSNYTTAIQTLNSALKNCPDFVKFLQSEKVVKQIGKSDLPDYLILPIQRLPRYAMLLKELIQCTPREDPERRPLQLALSKIQKVLDDNQQAQEDIDNIQKVMSIQKVLGIKLVEADRRFVREGNLLVYHPKKETVKSRQFVLFNNLLVEAAILEGEDARLKHIKSYRLDGACRLEKSPVNDEALITLSQVLPSESLVSNTFNLWVQTEKVVFVAPSPDLKMQWINDLDRYLDHQRGVELARKKTLQSLKLFKPPGVSSTSTLPTSPSSPESSRTPGLT